MHQPLEGGQWGGFGQRGRVSVATQAGLPERVRLGSAAAVSSDSVCQAQRPSSSETGVSAHD